MSLPTSCSSAPMRNQNSVRSSKPRARGERAGEVGDALAVTLRVPVLRFDRLAPAPHDVEELALEVRRLPVDVGEVATRAQLREEPVRAVQRLQRVAVASLTAVQLGLLARGLRQQQQVLSRRRDLRRFCSIDSACVRSPPSRAITPISWYASPGMCASPSCRCEGHRGVGGVARARNVAARHPHLGDVHLDLHAERDVAEVAHRARSPRDTTRSASSQRSVSVYTMPRLLSATQTSRCSPSVR